MLKQLILEDISNFMKELGEEYSFIDNEYNLNLLNFKIFLGIFII